MNHRVVMVLIFLLFIPIVYAGNGCCGETLNGDSCFYTSEENCATPDYFNENSLCEETSFCGSGCCVSDYGCFEGSGEYSCALDSGEYFEGKECSSIDSCEMVCWTDKSFLSCFSYIQ